MPDLSTQTLIDLVDRLRGQAVLVVGDVMLDHYVWGEVERISPEAPVPVLRVERESELPGGAANVARNLAALGAAPVLLGLIGDDERGERLRGHCEADGIDASFASASRPTTTKTRYLAQGQQLLRADREAVADLPAPAEQALLDLLRRRLPEVEVVVVSDYAKGVFTPAVAAALRASPARVIIDPRPARKALYRGFHLMTPNHREAALIADTDPHEHPPRAAAEAIAAAYTEHVLVTCGSRGMLLLEAAAAPVELPARARAVYDVTGAGDTVAAVVGAALAAGASLREAAELGNHAGGVAVGRLGAATVSPDELRAHILDHD